MSAKANYYLDITRETCPMTFVRTKLMIEKLRFQETIEIRLKGQEPLANVPRSAVELGHELVGIEREPGEAADGVHRLIIRKM